MYILYNIYIYSIYNIYEIYTVYIIYRGWATVGAHFFYSFMSKNVTTLERGEHFFLNVRFAEAKRSFLFIEHTSNANPKINKMADPRIELLSNQTAASRDSGVSHFLFFLKNNLLNTSQLFLLATAQNLKLLHSQRPAEAAWGISAREATWMCGVGSVWVRDSRIRKCKSCKFFTHARKKCCEVF